MRLLQGRPLPGLQRSRRLHWRRREHLLNVTVLMLLQSSSGKSQAPENDPRRTHLSIRSKARSSTGGEKPQPEPVTYPAELSLRLGAKCSFQPWLHMRITQKFFKIPMPGLHLKPIK